MVFVDKWPTEGKIEITGLSVKYRVELDYALKNLTLSIPAGAKVVKMRFIYIMLGSILYRINTRWKLNLCPDVDTYCGLEPGHRWAYADAQGVAKAR